MRFEQCHRWRVSFRDPEDAGTRFREFTFADADKISALVDRTGTRLLLEDRQALELGLRTGVGGMVLLLTEAQYKKLLR
jgi:hypothetical protein